MRVSCILLVIFLAACENNSETQVAGNKIEIVFRGSFNANDWIEIDGVRFIHQITDTSGVVKALYEPFEGYRNQALNRNICIVPPTVVYVGLGEQWGEFTLNQSQMAYHFTTVFNTVMNNKSGNGYKFLSNELAMFGGRIQFARKDGSKIHVRTSKQYPAVITSSN